MVCEPTSLRGLGILSSKECNWALLAKWGWIYLSSSFAPWRCIVAWACFSSRGWEVASLDCSWSYIIEYCRIFLFPYLIIVVNLLGYLWEYEQLLPDSLIYIYVYMAFVAMWDRFGMHHIWLFEWTKLLCYSISFLNKRKRNIILQIPIFVTNALASKIHFTSTCIFFLISIPIAMFFKSLNDIILSLYQVTKYKLNSMRNKELYKQFIPLQLHHS